MTNPGKQKKTPFPEKWKTGNGVEGKTNLSPSKERKKNKSSNILYTAFPDLSRVYEKFPERTWQNVKKILLDKVKDRFL